MRMPAWRVPIESSRHDSGPYVSKSCTQREMQHWSAWMSARGSAGECSTSRPPRSPRRSTPDSAPGLSSLASSSAIVIMRVMKRVSISRTSSWKIHATSRICVTSALAVGFFLPKRPLSTGGGSCRSDWMIRTARSMHDGCNCSK